MIIFRLNVEVLLEGECRMKSTEWQCWGWQTETEVEIKRENIIISLKPSYPADQMLFICQGYLCSWSHCAPLIKPPKHPSYWHRWNLRHFFQVLFLFFFLFLLFFLLLALSLMAPRCSKYMKQETHTQKKKEKKKNLTRRVGEKIKEDQVRHKGDEGEEEERRQRGWRLSGFDARLQQRGLRETPQPEKWSDDSH